MKLQKLLTIGFLFVISVAAASAQNTLPNPSDDSCWSSLDALRACQLRAYNAAQDYEQRCTSYPEYQCIAAEQQTVSQAGAKPATNNAGQATSARKAGQKPLVPSDASTRTANAK